MRPVVGRRAREAVVTCRTGVIVWIAVVAIADARTAWTRQVSGPTGRCRGIHAVSEQVAWTTEHNGAVGRTVDSGSL